MGTQKSVPGLDWTSVATAATAWLRAARALRVGWSRNVLECYDSPWRFEFSGTRRWLDVTGCFLSLPAGTPHTVVSGLLAAHIVLPG